MKSAQIYANMTRDITIDLGNTTENDIGQDLTVYAALAIATLTVKAQSDARSMAIYCPVTTGGASVDCIIDCANNIGTDQCGQLLMHQTLAVNHHEIVSHRLKGN